VSAFHWIDGERTIAFGRGKLADARFLLGDEAYTVLTTPRAAGAAPDVIAGAAAVHEVAPGRVDELAAELRDSVGDPPTPLLVALGGGRVIDVAKALAAADPPRRVAAIPTTLSGAEMTAIHRQAAGVPPEGARRVRPAIVINDPALCASQPPRQLAESAGNALGHAFEGPLTPLRNPVAREAALQATRLIAASLTPDGLVAHGGEDGARDRLALGALLAGYVIGSTAYGLHHVLSQTLVRFAGVAHGAANAIMLPQSLEALRWRFSDELASFEADAGVDLSELARRVLSLTGATRLRQVVADETVVERCAGEAASRPDLAMTGPPAERAELLELYRAAW
jgi:alcohol dehydrogenase class IV